MIVMPFRADEGARTGSLRIAIKCPASRAGQLVSTISGGSIYVSIFLCNYVCLLPYNSRTVGPKDPKFSGYTPLGPDLENRLFGFEVSQG